MTTLKERAQTGRTILEDAILDALRQSPKGLYNNEIARMLGLESDYEGRQANYLTYSLIGGMLADGRLKREKRDNRVFYMAA